MCRDALARWKGARRMTYVYRCPTCGRCNRPDVPVVAYCQHTGTIHDAKRQATMVRVWENEGPCGEQEAALTAPRSAGTHLVRRKGSTA